MTMSSPPAPVVKLVIVGAGPQALTLLLRLIHGKPEMLSEAVRGSIANHEVPMNAKIGSWKDCKRTAQKMASRTKSRLCECDLSPSFVANNICVIDRHGRWMHEWHEAYESLAIPFLRSPVDVHPSPGDPRELFAFGRHLKSTFTDFESHADINGGFCGPYILPPSDLFARFCSRLIDAFDVRDTVRKGEVVDVIPPESDGDPYCVVMEDGSRILSENVVLAPGPIMRQCPMFWEKEVKQKEKIIASKSIVSWIPTIETEMESVIICGGGITSVHTTVKLLEANLAAKVTIVCRSELRLQQFDVPSKWFGCQRGGLLKKYWETENLSDRILYCRGQRGGGSISQQVQDLLQPYLDDGRCTLREEAEIAEVFDGEDSLLMYLSDGEELVGDVIVLAVGTDVALEEYAFLRTIMKDPRYPTSMELPALRHDLTWGTDGLFVMGALAMIEIGPDALNLTGGRHAACRVASSLRPVLRAAAACQ